MTADPLALHPSRTVAACPVRVFDAWTTADQLKHWTCPDPSAIVDVDIDLRVGGHYSIRMDAEGEPFTAHGTYQVVDPPRRLVYTWGWKEETHPKKRETMNTGPELATFAELDWLPLAELSDDPSPATSVRPTPTRSSSISAIPTRPAAGGVRTPSNRRFPKKIPTRALPS